MPALADAQELLKRVYLEEQTVFDQFEQGSPLHDIIDSGSDVTDAVTVLGRYEGEHMVLMQRTGGPLNSAIGYLDTDEHAAEGGNVYRRAKYLTAHLTSTLNMSSLAALHNSGGEQSTDDLLSLEIDGQISANRKKVSIQMHGSASGDLARVPASGNNWTDATKKLTLDDVSNIMDAPPTALAKYRQEILPRTLAAGGLHAGTLATDYDDYNGGDAPATGLKPKPARITAVDRDNNTITLEYYDGTDFEGHDAAAFAATDFNGFGIYSYDSQHKNMWGLRDFCSSGNPDASGYDPASPTTLLTTDALQIRGLLGGINKVTNTDWQGKQFTATALGGQAAPSIDLHINNILNRIDKRAGGDLGWLLGVTGYDVRDALRAEGMRQNRTNFEIQIDDGHGGYYEALKIRNLYIITDQDAVASELKIFEVDAMFRVIPEPWRMDDTTGTPWNRATGALGRGRPAFNAYWVTGQQLMSARNLGMARITGFAPVTL